MRVGNHLVTERLEQTAQEVFAAPARQNRDARLQRDCLLCEFRPVLAAPAEGRAEHASDGDAQEGRSDVGPVVHILLQRAGLAGWALPPAHEPYGVHLQHQRGRAAFRRRLRIEDVGLAEGEIERVQPRRVLGQQVAQIGGRSGGCRKRQQHRCLALKGPAVSPQRSWSQSYSGSRNPDWLPLCFGPMLSRPNGPFPASLVCRRFSLPPSSLPITSRAPPRLRSPAPQLASAYLRSSPSLPRKTASSPNPLDFLPIRPIPRPPDLPSSLQSGPGRPLLL